MSIEADKLHTLHHQLSTLEELFKEVASQYEMAAHSLREGLLPERTPGFQLDAARKVLLDTLSALSEVGESYGIAAISQNASLPSAYDYLTTIRDAKEEEDRKEKLFTDARSVISEAQSLTHLNNGEALSHVYDSIVQLSDRINDDDLEEAERVVNGEHPISMLAAYTGHRDSLSDEEYDSFRNHIEEYFGRPVLRDIDRGRITLIFDASETSEIIIEEEQLETQNEIIDIIDETEDGHEEIIETVSIEIEDSDPLPPLEDTLNDNDISFWPPIQDDADGDGAFAGSDHTEHTLNIEDEQIETEQFESEQFESDHFDADQTFDPEDTIPGHFSNEEQTN